MSRFLAVLLLFGFTQGRAANAQSPAAPLPLTSDTPEKAPDVEMTFSYKPLPEDQPSWVIRLRGDQTGSFRELGSAAAAQPLHVSEALWKKLRAEAAGVTDGKCETRSKGIARTGVKMLSLAHGAAVASCTFNYSDREGLNEAANDFLALAQTMQQGARLQHDLRFERLALDADIDVLLAQIAGGSALEPGNIAPVLRSIADDERVIDRVRRKAARLLQSAADPSSPR